MRDISVRVITDGKERRQNISKKKIADGNPTDRADAAGWADGI